MRPLWIILGLFLAGISYGTIVWWPEQPVWKTKVSRFSEILSFSPNDQTVYVLDEKRDDVNQPRNPQVSQWDTPTGKLLSETRIQVPEHLDGAEYQISSDCSAILVRGRTPGASGPRVFYVFEPASGQKRCGPIKGAQADFSRTGRWIVCYFFSKEEPSVDAGIEVVEAKSGRTILHLSDFGESSVRSVCFSPDDLAIALLQQKHGTVDDFTVRVLDLPSGKEKARVALTKRQWLYLKTWEGHFLTAHTQEYEVSKRESTLKAFALDLESDPIGKESECPELERRARASDGNEPFIMIWHKIDRGKQWRAEAELSEVVENSFQKYWNQCAEWLGANKLVVSGMECRMRILDLNTNHIVYQSPRFVNSSPRMSGDGVSYAVMSDAGELSLWKAESHLRWPWALASSISLLAVTLLIGRWRSSTKAVVQLNHAM